MQWFWEMFTHILAHPKHQQVVWWQMVLFSPLSPPLSPYRSRHLSSLLLVVASPSFLSPSLLSLSLSLPSRNTPLPRSLKLSLPSDRSWLFLFPILAIGQQAGKGAYSSGSRPNPQPFTRFITFKMDRHPHTHIVNDTKCKLQETDSTRLIVYQEMTTVKKWQTWCVDWFLPRGVGRVMVCRGVSSTERGVSASGSSRGCRRMLVSSRHLIPVIAGCRCRVCRECSVW